MRKNPVDENSLRKASALLARQWVAEAEKILETEGTPAPSSAFQKKMEALLRGETAAKKHRILSIKPALAAVAMILVALLTWFALRPAAPIRQTLWLPEGEELVRWEEGGSREGWYSLSILFQDDHKLNIRCGKYKAPVSYKPESLGSSLNLEQMEEGEKTVDVYRRGSQDDYQYVWMDEEEKLYFLIWSTFDAETNRKIIHQLSAEIMENSGKSVSDSVALIRLVSEKTKRRTSP